MLKLRGQFVNVWVWSDGPACTVFYFPLQQPGGIFQTVKQNCCSFKLASKLKMNTIKSHLSSFLSTMTEQSWRDWKSVFRNKSCILCHYSFPVPELPVITGFDLIPPPALKLIYNPFFLVCVCVSLAPDAWHRHRWSVCPLSL